MSDPKYKVVELSSLKMEDGAEELATTPEMQPYLRYIEDALLEKDLGPSVQAIAELPLEKRYVWRVASALKWDSLISKTGTSWPEASPARGFRQADEAAGFRPIQFCLFL